MACCSNPLITKCIQKPILSAIKSEHDASSPVSIMYHGGTIRPIAGGSMAKVEAIAFKNGKVVAAGSKIEVAKKMKSFKTDFERVELSDGQTLLPGFIEPHVHIVPTATTWTFPDFGPFDGQDYRKGYDLDWLKKKIAETKKELELSGDLARGAWILGTQLDPSLMPFEIVPNGLTKLLSFDPDTIDDMESEIPIYIVAASGHTAYVNTPALQATYDAHEHIQAEFGTFDKYRAHVVAGGGLQEIPEMQPASEVIPGWQTEFHIENLDELFKIAHSRGVTLLYDAATAPEYIPILDAYFKTNPLKIRVGYGKLCNSIEEAKALPDYVPMSDFKNNYHGSIKLISDGSNQGLTGYQFETYRCEPANNIGAFNFPPFSHPDEMTPDSEFSQLVKTIADKGWPLMIHGNGNKAITFVLDAYKFALNGVSGHVKRHRIEHCSLLDDGLMQRLYDQGISPSFLIGHVGYWGYAFKNAIFEEKADTLGRCRSAVTKGLRVSLHSDNFVTPMGPLRMMEQAITRIMEGDPNRNVLNENEKITPEQALRIITYDAAWHCHSEKWVGSLEEGKMADYVILGEDPITRPDPVGMRDIPVLETWIGGKRVFKKSQ